MQIYEWQEAANQDYSTSPWHQKLGLIFPCLFAGERPVPRSEAESEANSDWQPVAKSRNAARKKDRHAARRAARDLAFRSETTSLAAEDDDESEPEEAGDRASSSSREEAEAHSALAAAEEGNGSEDESDTHEAGVVIMTGDFAMQNMILQMGLRLAAPDGKRVNRVSRWVLRCSACFKVTKVSRLERNTSSSTFGCSNPEITCTSWSYVPAHWCAFSMEPELEASIKTGMKGSHG